MYRIICLQKNPTTIRQPEEDRGKENYTMTGWVILKKSAPISRHISALCQEAKDSTYVREVDLKAWAELPGNLDTYMSTPYILMHYTQTLTQVHQYPIWSWLDICFRQRRRLGVVM